VNTPRPSADEVPGGKNLPPSRKRPKTNRDAVLERTMRVVEDIHSRIMTMKDEEGDKETLAGCFKRDIRELVARTALPLMAPPPLQYTTFAVDAK
jgi:hypothetical protein